MNDFLARMRLAFDNLNEREQALVTVLGAVMGMFILGLPLFLMHTDNRELQADNEDLRGLVARIVAKAPQYAQLSKARVAAQRRYQNRTPPLGSYVEAEAGKQGLTVKEANDQPDKSAGGYLRRSLHASFSGVALTPALNLMASLADSPYPVAIEKIQIEHYKRGDEYNMTIGVLTFDKKNKESKAASKDKP